MFDVTFCSLKLLCVDVLYYCFDSVAYISVCVCVIFFLYNRNLSKTKTITQLLLYGPLTFVQFIDWVSCR